MNFIIHILVGLLLGSGSMNASNFVYKFKGHKYASVIRLGVIISGDIIAYVSMGLLDYLDVAEDDFIMIYTPLVSILVGLIGWGLYLEKTGKALWKNDNGNFSK